MVCFHGIGNEENYQDSLANAAKHCKQESEMTCSAARTQESGLNEVEVPIHPRQRRPGSMGVSSEEIRPEAMHERV
jgi:hypothetical protein